MDQQQPVPDSTRGSLPTNWTAEIEPARQPGDALQALVVASLRRLTRRATYKWYAALGDEAEDVVQSFAVKMLEGKVVCKADRTKGRFRTFLRSSFDHHVIDWLRRRANAPGVVPDLGDVAVDESFDGIWAEELFHQSCEQLRIRCQTEGALDIWNVACDQIIGPLLGETNPLPHAELAARLGLASPNVVAGKLRTARKWFHQCTLSIVRQYTADDDDTQVELDTYVNSLSRLSRLLKPSEPNVVTFYTHLSAELADYDSVRWAQVAALAHRAVPPILTFDDLFHHPAPPIELLKLVKDFAKCKGDRRGSEMPREVADVLLYASILTAVRTRQEKISKLTDDELAVGTRWCQRRSWLDERTMRLFSDPYPPDAPTP